VFRRLTEFFALERNVAAAAAAMFLMGLGEELWKRFVPKYLAVLGAPVVAIGLYGTIKDFLDGAFQYPGGWVADRYGRRHALQLFVALAAAGYAVYLAAPSWPWVFAGLALTMAWASAASPTLFAVIGDALPSERRTMGFTVQSILRRVPILFAPAIGGYMIASFGTRTGVRIGLVVAIVAAATTFAIVSRVELPRHEGTDMVRVGGVWRAVPRPLRRLLLSDVLVRTCEGLADVFLVLYAVDVIGVSAPQFGVLVAIQMASAIVVYVPAARIARRAGKKPFVIATFVAFALFPLAVALSRGFGSLALAFTIGGLREIGEPARKALIVDLAEPRLRARTVGLYYLVRSMAISPAAAIGGLLWGVRPELPFVIACGFGLAGAVVFAATVRPHEAG
jgi:MFS family permease